LPADIKQGTALMIEKFIQATLKADSRETSAFGPHILSVLENDGGLVMFDGLDEVGNLSLRPVVIQAVEAFTEKYAHNPNSRFLVTCRTYSYQDKRWQLTRWPVHELALLDDEQIHQFVNAWYDQHMQLDPAKKLEYIDKRGKLLDALRRGDRRRLWEVAPYPIILTMMAIIHASYELPDSRAQVYMQCVELLLEKWQTKRSIMGHEQYRSILAELGIPATRLYQALYEIAFEAHRSREENDDQNGDGSLVTERLVAGILQEHLQDEEKLRIFLEYCHSANGLLMLQGTVTPARAEPGTPPRRVYTFPT
jgi:predicted NACHT family NTPase